jgi:hypothetical protein
MGDTRVPNDGNEGEVELTRAFQACHRGLMTDASPVERRRVRAPDPEWTTMCSAVASFTRRSRDGGMPPEQVLVRLKDLLSDAAPGLSRESPLRNAILRCCLNAYFSAD